MKEIENLRNQFNQELDRLLKRQQQDLDKDTKSGLNEEKKLQKQLTQQHDQETKEFVSKQKKEYKSKKEEYKEVSYIFIFLTSLIFCMKYCKQLIWIEIFFKFKTIFFRHIIL